MIYRSPHPPVTIPDVSLADFILERTAHHGDKPALIDGISGRIYTFPEFADRVRWVAGSLDEAGFGAGDVLGFLAPNSPEYGIFFLAASSLGGVNTTINPLATPDDITRQLASSGARFLFTTPNIRGKLTADTTTGLEQVFLRTPDGAVSGLNEGRREGPAVTVSPATDVAALPYSSGTTGVSKGVMLTHRNLTANLVQIEAAGIFTPEDTIIGLLPFFHIYGMTVILLAGLSIGATTVTLPRFEMDGFLETMERYGVSHANLVPPLIHTLAAHPTLDPARLGKLQRVQSGAAPLATQTATRFSERFGCQVLQGYGLTETSPVTHVVPRTATGIPIGSIGPPIPDTECRIVDVGTGQDVGPTKRGEIWVRGPQVMKGYLGDKEKTAGMLDRDGWLHTGDIGYADEEGNFYIVYRLKELIKYKGYSVAPAELEAALLMHPAIDDVAVIPSPDEEAGEVPKAYVVLGAPLREADLLSWIAERVAPYQKIRRMEAIDEIPKSASGKILRRVLIERDRSSRSESKP